MKKLEIKVFENHRVFGDPEEIEFKTDLACRSCLNVTGNYILIEGWIRVCQGCLNEWIKKLQKNKLENIEKARRVE